MSFEISGKLVEIFDLVKISDTFRKREFVIEHTDSAGNMDFTDQIKFQLTQDRCSILDEFNINDEVKVNFRIRGRRWEKDGRVNYFNNLEAWRIEKIAVSPDEFSSPPPISEKDMPPEDEADDLPF
jgi:hypothetical protein